MEKLDYLIKYLLQEQNQSIEQEPTGIEDKKRLYRALVNIREAKPISPEFLEIEDEYLQQELNNHEITNQEDIKTIKEKYSYSTLQNPEKISLWQGDITSLKIDCIVNAANSRRIRMFSANA